MEHREILNLLNNANDSRIWNIPYLLNVSQRLMEQQ